MKISDFKSYFKKKKEEPKLPKLILSDEEKFNIDKYNIWFKTIYSGYTGHPGAPGIFLRLDKLGESMISDWFEYLNVEYSDSDVRKMHESIRLNWRELLSKL